MAIVPLTPARKLPAFFILALACLTSAVCSADMPWIRISADKKSFIREDTEKPFVPWGVNYDRDDRSRLLEDYWDAEWPAIESHFATVRELKANVVRIHLQFGKFMDGPGKPNRHSLKQLERLIDLAERTKLYLDVTGLGCYHKRDVPAWYDDLSEEDRWNAQADFWRAIAESCKNSPAIFCYDLMNEPVVPGGRRPARDWLGPPFGDKHYVQFITLDQRNRPRPQIASAWLEHLVNAIRGVDKRHLITVGLVDWSLDRPGLTSGFVPNVVAEKVDFLSVHIYPESKKTAEALQTLAGFAVGKPIVIEETFPLKCSTDELAQFIQDSKQHASGWISFYWGKPLDELRKSRELVDAILWQWLQRFEKLAPLMTE